MRLDKYTPGAANEVRSWIEGVLGEPLASGDLLDSLKDGVALCKYSEPFLDLMMILTLSRQARQPCDTNPGSQV
jgi:hypothetical protein